MGWLSPDEARERAIEAYTWGFAIAENYKAMYAMAVWPESSQYSGFNRYLHGRRLFDADYTAVVNANNDTLYSTAFADLRSEPIVITTPPTGDRYFVIQLVDMGTDNFAYIGTRTTGPDGGDFLLVGPSWKGEVPTDGFTRVIAAPSEFVALATRTAIDGEADLPNVIEVQEGLRIRPLSKFLGTPPPVPAPALVLPPFDLGIHGTSRLLALVNALLPFHMPPAFEAPLLHRLAEIGVGAHRTYPPEGMPGDVQRAIEEGCALAQQRIEERSMRLGSVIEGWQEIPPMGDYGDDYLFRAAVAWKFIYTNSPEEALYPLAETDADGEPFSGAHAYELHFEPGRLPPVGAFWSLTLYDAVSRLMVHNPIDRFSIGDRTPGLIYGEDGSLTILIQHERPAQDANWLPAPEGSFYLNVRAYMPDEAMRTGAYRLPPVRQVG